MLDRHFRKWNQDHQICLNTFSREKLLIPKHMMHCMTASCCSKFSGSTPEMDISGRKWNHSSLIIWWVWILQHREPAWPFVKLQKEERITKVELNSSMLSLNFWRTENWLQEPNWPVCQSKTLVLPDYILHFFFNFLFQHIQPFVIGTRVLQWT